MQRYMIFTSVQLAISKLVACHLCLSYGIGSCLWLDAPLTSKRTFWLRQRFIACEMVEHYCCVPYKFSEKRIGTLHILNVRGCCLTDVIFDFGFLFGSVAMNLENFWLFLLLIFYFHVLKWYLGLWSTRFYRHWMAKWANQNVTYWEYRKMLLYE